MPFNLIPLKYYLGIGLISILALFFYFFHTQPMAKLKEDNKKQETIIKEIEDETKKDKIKSDSFSDKWKTIRELEYLIPISNIKDHNDTQININTSPGKHAISI